MSAEATRVVVCIATFRRPKGLERLLASLNAQVFDGASPSISVVVVDNDAGDPIGKRHDVAKWCKYPLEYAVEEKRGVAAVRNRALDHVPANTDFIAFVDDDEEASPQWLDELLKTQARFGATAVQGPVEPSYERDAPPWIREGGYFRLGPYEDGQMLEYAGTNNSLISWPFMRAANLRFDMRFNLTGGEDQDLFDRLRIEHGGRIVASSRALVRDDVPAGRMTESWVIKRWFRIGNTLGRIAVIRRRNRLKRLAKGMARIIRGGGQMLAGAVTSRTRFIKGAADLAWGTGTVFAYLNFSYDEYAAPSYRKTNESPGKAH